jgi:hypothetical protein
MKKIKLLLIGLCVSLIVITSFNKSVLAYAPGGMVECYLDTYDCKGDMLILEFHNAAMCGKSYIYCGDPERVCNKF